jgi:hypothetical protein
MRRALSFTIAAALLIGGLYILLVHVVFADVIRGIVLMVSGAMIGLGSYWLWEDFIAPAFGQKTGA